MPPVEVLPAALTESDKVNVAIVSTAVASVAMLASPAAPMQASRALSVLELSQCSWQHGHEVAFPQSVWPGYGFGRADRPAGRYYRGAVVAGVCTAVGVLAAGCAVVLVAAKVMPQRDPMEQTAKCDVVIGSRDRVAKLLRFPGFMTIVAGMLLDGVVSNAVSAVAHGGDPALDVPVLLLCVVAVAALVASSLVIPMRLAPSRCVYVPVPPTTTRTKGMLMGWHVWNANPVIDGSTVAFLGSMGQFFTKYREPMKMMYAIEVGLTVTVAVFTGLKPQNSALCRTMLVVVTLVNVVSLVIAVGLRPYSSAVRNGISTAVAFFTAAGSGSVTAGVFLDASGPLQAGRVLLIFAGYLSMASVALTVYRYTCSADAKVKEPHAQEGAAVSSLDDGANGIEKPLLAVPSASAPPSSDPMVAQLVADGTTAVFEERSAADPQLLTEDLNLQAPERGRSPLPLMAPQRDIFGADDALHSDRVWIEIRPRQVSRTREGQLLFEELETMLRGAGPADSVVAQVVPTIPEFSFDEL